eukprot:1318651-Amorphochlora_amoeboformis.AAC.3
MRMLISSAIAIEAFKNGMRRRSVVGQNVEKTIAEATTALQVPPRDTRARRGSTPGLNLGTKKVTLDFVTAMMDNFQAGILLDAPTVVRIVSQTTVYLEALPNVVEAKVTRALTIIEPASLTVVGDLHGQLEDLLHIFQLNG